MSFADMKKKRGDKDSSDEDNSSSEVFEEDPHIKEFTEISNEFINSLITN